MLTAFFAAGVVGAFEGTIDKVTALAVLLPVMAGQSGNGVAVALTTSFAVYLWSRSLGLSLVIGVSMVISMALAGLSGAAIPMLLTALRQYPAESSSIILTTVTDVVGFFSFLGIATLMMSAL